jgi:cell division protein FtsB
VIYELVKQVVSNPFIPNNQFGIKFCVLVNRLVARTNQLESEKAQKEAEVQKVVEENVRLRAMIDKKEAQLQAMSEQCKFMALSRPN